jgi:uncharacterized protein YdiU (UPF0061 family)
VAGDVANPCLALLDHVIGVQCALVAKWMALGFVHGVMNTDNMTLSGETIDYGPCAFIDTYSAGAVYSSIDHGGRYAFGRQPHILHWNLARLAEALLPAITAVRAEDHATAVALIEGVPGRYYPAMLAEMRAKLGLVTAQEGDQALVEALFAALEGEEVDFTRFFSALTAEVAASAKVAARSAALTAWLAAWRERAGEDGRVLAQRLALMQAANPVVIPRNLLVEAALIAAVDADDYTPFDALLAATSNPFAPRAADDPMTQPPAPDAPPHVTFCGT